MVRIPDEYQEVEYLQSTGTQYIITNYHPQTDWTAVDWKFAFTASQNGDQMLWGARSATNGRKVWQCEKYSGRSWYVACGSVSYRIVLANYGGKLNRIYTGHVDNTTLTVDSGSASPTQTNTGENESTMGIFCWNKNGTAEYKNSGLQIYSLTFKENDIVSANFIPCYRKSDNEPGMYDTASGTFYTNSGTGEFLIGNPVSYGMTNLLELRHRILMNTPLLESLTGTTLQFTTDMTSKLKECKVHFSPVQEGSGDPSPDNVRPIHGWDGVTVYKNGAEDFYNYSNVTALNSASVTKINDKSFRLHALNRKYPASKQPTSSLSLTIGKRYIISFDITIDSMASGHICAFGFRNTANTFQTDGRVNISESGHYILDFVYDSNANKNYLSLCETSGASVTFDATISNLCIYEILEITIPFPQTIYGGYVDLVKGEVVETILGITANSEDASLNAVKNTNVWGQLSLSQFAAPSSDIVLSNIFKGGHYSTSWNARAGATGNRIIFGIPLEYNTTAKIKNFFEDNQTQFAYQLQTPTTYSLDPVTIRTLKGLNNIWSDANGNIELKFWTH